jgi:S-DNA-T family DNA segregation ATPase FtsK/SpoIIIE
LPRLSNTVLTFLRKGLLALFHLGKKVLACKKGDWPETRSPKERDPLPLFRKREEPQLIQKEPVIIVPPVTDKVLPEKSKSFSQPPMPSGFKLPPLSLLHDPQREVTQIERDLLLQNSRLLENKLNDFGVQTTVVNVHPGPVVTLYELEPAPGVKINRIVNLADDLALGLKAMGIRIIAPIPGRGAIGVEIPNKNRETVFFKEIVGQEKFLHNESPLTLGMGKDIYGMPIISDLAKMPHLLIAGTTGSGKSVFLNSLICSILYKALPTDVKLLFIDPKRSELTLYADIPHLIYPVVTDAKQAAEALRWAVEEMERRYRLLARMGARDIWVYNRKVTTSQAGTLFSDAPKNGEDEPPQKMPWIVIVIDELANLMTVSTREVEWLIARLAQMARAAGIHLLVATQRPSVDIVTGTIKANFAARISFRLATKTDSRIILDCNGAENLLNQGDMLFLSPRSGRIKRLQGPFLSDDEIVRIVQFLKEQAKPEYQELHLEVAEETTDDTDDVTDEKYREAVELVTNLGQASISLIQRKLRIGYNRAARMIEKMEEDGIVGPSDGVKPREVFRKLVDI